MPSASASISNAAAGRSLGYRVSDAELSDLWLCLACALGWTIWLISSRKQSEPARSVYDQEESIQVTGNVLEVTVGEDADGTGIPVYLALIDYVVEYYDPDIDTVKFLPQKSNEGNTNFSEGVVLPPDTNTTKDNHVQVRKCFYTNRLLEEGFANVKVICLFSDPTTSMLYDDYLQERRQLKKPDDAIVLYLVYAIATTLIVTSLYGGYRTIPRLSSSQRNLAYGILIVGTILLYPLAKLLYYSFTIGYRKVSERKGTIIHGSEKFQCARMACGVHPIMEEDNADQEASSLNKNSSLTQRRHNGKIENLQGLEMPNLNESSTSEYIPPPPPRQYPNAGCGLNEYNVQTLQHNDSTVSSISSNGTVKSYSSSTRINSCLSGEATIQLMEAFQSMSAMATAPAALEVSGEPASIEETLQIVGQPTQSTEEKCADDKKNTQGENDEDDAQNIHSA